MTRHALLPSVPPHAALWVDTKSRQGSKAAAASRQLAVSSIMCLCRALGQGGWGILDAACTIMRLVRLASCLCRRDFNNTELLEAYNEILVSLRESGAMTEGFLFHK